MTTSDNALLIKHAHECIRFANSTSWKMIDILRHWNAGVQQVNGTCFLEIRDFHRKAKIIAALESIIAELEAAPVAVEAAPVAVETTTRRDEIEHMIDLLDDAISDRNIPAARGWKADIAAAIEADHAEALELDARRDAAPADDAADLVREAIRIANRDHGHWITGAQVAAMLADGTEYTAEQLARAVVNQARAAARLEQYGEQLTAAQQDYNTAADASEAALTAAVEADPEGTQDTPAFDAYEAAEAALMEKTTALLQACGRYSVELARQLGKAVADIEALKTMFAPYYSGNTENVHPGRRNQLVSKALEINVSATQSA